MEQCAPVIKQEMNSVHFFALPVYVSTFNIYTLEHENDYHMCRVAVLCAVDKDHSFHQHIGYIHIYILKDVSSAH